MAGVIEPAELMLGDSTEYGDAVDYRLAKVSAAFQIQGRWLDCGCADGAYAVALRALGASEVVGIDVTQEQIDATQAKWRDVEGVKFVCASAESLPFDEGSFDGVLLNEVLEHVPSQRRVLAELRRTLRPDGHIVVFSPNRWFPFEGHGAVFGRVRAPFPFPLIPWLPQRLTWQWTTARNYWPRQLVRIVAAAGFEIDHVGFAFPLFARYRWLPSRVVQAYSSALPKLEQLPFIRRFGVSTLVIGRVASR